MFSIQRQSQKNTWAVYFQRNSMGLDYDTPFQNQMASQLTESRSLLGVKTPSYHHQGLEVYLKSEYIAKE